MNRFGPPVQPTIGLPLYRDLRQFCRAGSDHGTEYESRWATANPGLRFDKFVDRWPRRDAKVEGKDKQGFWRSFAEWYGHDRVQQGLAQLLHAHHRRLEQLLVMLGGRWIEAITSSRLVVGLGDGHPFETGLTWHRTLGVPYLPGSSIKGLARAWAEPETGWDMANAVTVSRLFGDLSTQGAGAVIWFDALPVAVPKLELDILNPHFSEYYQDPTNRKTHPADYLDPVPVTFLTVAPNTPFRMALAPRSPADRADLEAGAELLCAALTQLGAGGKTAVGYGLFSEAKLV